jgi:hypothetical protein
MTAPLMPKATAVWLVENTTLTFKQIAAFCELHELEVQAIADGDIAYNILGVSPISNGQLTIEEIKRCEADEKAVLTASPLERSVKERNAKAKKVLSPTQRAEKPNAVLWILKNCPEVIDSQICKLIGTTKTTINAIRNGTHSNMANLRPINPMGVGLCSEKDLEKAMMISQQQTELKENKGKKTAKKTTAKKKPVAKKAPAKAAQKKTTKAAAAKTVKKTTAKKAAPKKTVAKKTAAKKTTVKAVAKKAPAKKVAAKKAPAKKPVAKKAATKTTVKKAAAKKAVTKKATSKKVAAKKTVAKKAATKTAVKKAPAKKAAPKKVPAKKAVKPAAKKAPAKKPAAKKAPAKKK